MLGVCNTTTRACGMGKLLWTKPERKQTAFEGEFKNKNKKRASVWTP